MFKSVCFKIIAAKRSRLGTTVYHIKAPLVLLEVETASIDEQPWAVPIITLSLINLQGRRKLLQNCQSIAQETIQA
jgi:hypothetical protein